MRPVHPVTGVIVKCLVVLFILFCFESILQDKVTPRTYSAKYVCNACHVRGELFIAKCISSSQKCFILLFNANFTLGIKIELVLQLIKKYVGGRGSLGWCSREDGFQANFLALGGGGVIKRKSFAGY